MTNDIWPPTTRCLAGKDPKVYCGTAPQRSTGHGARSSDNPAAAFYEPPRVDATDFRSGG